MTVSITSPKPSIAAVGPEDAIGQSLHCRGVAKTFDKGANFALDHVDITIPAGRITVLLGPSGCGKTTLLRCITGLDVPTEGTIELADRDITNVPAEDRGIAMVFQNYALYPNKTVLGNIEFPLRMMRVPKRERRAAAAEMAELLKLDGLLERKPAELSGGQRQRVGIARALVRRPAVLVMDEPFSNLDAELRASMRAELVTVQQRLGMTIVFVTHDQIEALSLADHLIVMNAGHVEQAAPPEQVYGRPATTFVASFLGGMNLFPSNGFAAQLVHPEAHTVGIRPEDLNLGEGSPDDLTLTGVVTTSELHGRDRLVHLDTPAGAAQVRTAASTQPTGHLAVHAAQSDLHYFCVDGRSIGPVDPATPPEYPS